MKTTTIADWITKQDAAKLLGVKPRSIAEYIAAGKLTPQKYQRPGVGGGAVNLFNPEQVEALVQERANLKMEILKPAAAPGPLAHTYRVDARRIPPPAAAPEQTADRDRLDTIAADVSALARQFEQPAAPLSETRYMTLDQAAQYKGVSKAYIRAKLDGAPIGPHGRLVYRRDKIDKL